MLNIDNKWCDAIISIDGSYRYALSRELEDSIVEEEGTILYVGVNPSTADASVDDATVRKWKGVTRKMGFGRFLVANLFAYRATDVKELKRVEDPVGPDNDWYIEQCISRASVIVPCWGNSSKVPKDLIHRIKEVDDLLLDSGKPVRCFGKTKSGDPKHPLMLPYDTTIEEYFYV